MTMPQLHEQKYLINCQDGAKHAERATISFILAVTASKNAETAVFMTSDAAASRTMAFLATGAKVLA